MPLPFPNSIVRDKVFHNVAALEREGLPRSQAIAESFSIARAVYFKRFPQGRLPGWLMYRKDMPDAWHYLDNGKPIKSNPSARSNAVSREVKQAAALYADFTGHDVTNSVTVPFRGAGFSTGFIVGHTLGLDLLASNGVRFHLKFDRGDYPALAVSSTGGRVVFIGGDFSPVLDAGLDNAKIMTIMYETVRDDVREKYRHPFAHYARPALAVVDERNAKMIGGSFRFTDRGFVDHRR